MKILAFTYASTINGGANRSFLMVLEWLKVKYNSEITVVVPSYGPLCDCLDELSIKWIKHKSLIVGAVPISSIKNFFRTIRYEKNLIFDSLTSFRLEQKIKNKNYDIVYINDNSTFFGAIYAQKHSLPYVWHFRSDYDAKAFFVPGTKRLILPCDMVIAISEGMMKQYKKHPVLSKVNMKVVLNAIPIKNENPYSSHNRDSGLKILLCGRICEDKCQLDAVKAIKLIKDEYQVTDIFLQIVGEDSGKYYEQINTYICENDLSRQVSFSGFIDDMQHFREKMNCELICSKREPFGRVTLEGMRAGLVVIGANTGGTPEIITNGETGCLYEQGNIEDLAEKIMWVYSNPEAADILAQNAYSFSRVHFTPEEAVKAINTILLDCVNNKNHPYCNLDKT